MSKIKIDQKIVKYSVAKDDDKRKAAAAEAAHALHLSRRTADRRLAQARRALGVDRTVVAIAWAHRFGWLD